MVNAHKEEESEGMDGLVDAGRYAWPKGWIEGNAIAIIPFGYPWRVSDDGPEPTADLSYEEYRMRVERERKENRRRFTGED